MEMHAYRTLDDYKNAVVAGRKALDWNPSGVDALLTLANILPNRAEDSKDRDAILSEAESYARRTLSALSSLRAARTVPLMRWLKMKAQMNASAHEVLGQVRFKRGRFAESVAEFEICINQNPVPDGAQFCKLGVSYLFSRNPNQVRIALKRASSPGSETVRARAETLLTELETKWLVKP